MSGTPFILFWIFVVILWLAIIFAPELFPRLFDRLLSWLEARDWKRADRVATEMGMGFLILASFFLVAVVFHAFASGAVDRLVNQ